MKLLMLPLLLAFTFQAPAYRAGIEKFRADRAAEIAGPTGWAALVGLHWISQGEVVVGSDAISGIRLTGPSAPGRLGTLTVTGDKVHLRISTGLDAFVKGKQVYELDMKPGVAAADGLKIGGLTMVLIKRGARMALRVWDAKAPNLVAFKGLSWMPIDPKWRIDARFVPHPANQPRIKIQNVLGETIEMKNPGAVVFSVGGKEYRLEALLESDDADELFFIFKDGTSNRTTYGAGRYLYTPLPKNGRVDLDFNKAMNPPCAFTEFATCPLPPAKNRLTLSVQAVELNHEH